MANKIKNQFDKKYAKDQINYSLYFLSNKNDTKEIYLLTFYISEKYKDELPRQILPMNKRY